MSTTEMEPEVKQPVPAWRRFLVTSGWFALFCIAISAGVYLFNRHRLINQLDRLMAELDESDPGWRWPGPYQDRRPIPYEENSVPRILEVVNKLPRNWPDYKLTEKFQDVQPNMALDPPRRKILNELLAVDPVPDLRGKARDLVRYPRGQVEITLKELPFSILLPNHQKMREAANLLQLDAHALSLDKKHGEALKAARACLNVSRALDDDPTLIGQLIRIAVAAVAMNTVERTMALGDAPDDALAAFQEALKHEARGPGLTGAMRGERAGISQTVNLMGTGKVSLHDLEGGPRGAEWWDLKWIGNLAGREMARREHADILRLMTRVVETSKLPAKDQFAAEDDIENQLKSRNTGTITRMLVPAVHKVSAAGRRSQSVATAMRVLIAVERYRLKHGKFPAKLEDTVPAFLDKVPLDPIDGKPIRYAKWADGVVVYSIGNDRTDDGGKVEKQQQDFGFRLWDKDKRRAAPPPLPPDPPEDEAPVPPGPP